MTMTGKKARIPRPHAELAERRSRRRLNVQLDVEVTLDCGERHGRATESAKTRNISPGDLYFESSLADRLSVGDEMNLRIDLPVTANNLFGPRRLAVRARVVRIGEVSQESPNLRGVAVCFLDHPAFETSLK